MIEAMSKEILDMYQRAMNRITKACNCDAEECCWACELARQMQNVLTRHEAPPPTGLIKALSMSNDKFIEDILRLEKRVAELEKHLAFAKQYPKGIALSRKDGE